MTTNFTLDNYSLSFPSPIQSYINTNNVNFGTFNTSGINMITNTGQQNISSIFLPQGTTIGNLQFSNDQAARATLTKNMTNLL